MENYDAVRHLSQLIAVAVLGAAAIGALTWFRRDRRLLAPLGALLLTAALTAAGVAIGRGLLPVSTEPEVVDALTYAGIASAAVGLVAGLLLALGPSALRPAWALALVPFVEILVPGSPRLVLAVVAAGAVALTVRRWWHLPAVAAGFGLIWVVQSAFSAVSNVAAVVRPGMTMEWLAEYGLGVFEASLTVPAAHFVSALLIGIGVGAAIGLVLGRSTTTN